MKLRRIIAAALALMVVPAMALPAPAVAQAGVDWTARVERTAEGGHRMGNPRAPLKLVEYGSIACSHCADFEAVAGDEIRDHVRAGRLSFEYRPVVLFPSDPGIYLLLNCQAPDKFFPTLHTLYETQQSWMAKETAKEAELQAEVARSSLRAAMPSYVRASGVDALFRQNGLTDPQIAACLTSETGVQRLVATMEQAQRAGIDGTPTFLLNGEKLEIAGWTDLLVRLRQP
jgi:protein-disulfide isomerase